MQDRDTVTLMCEVPRDMAEPILALVGWLRHKHGGPRMTPDRPMLTNDAPFSNALQPLVEELAEAALWYVEQAEAEGWRVFPTTAALAAHQSEWKMDMAEKMRRLGID